MKKENMLQIIVTLIVMMFLYASFSKYFDFAGFKRAMGQQPFPSWLSMILAWIIRPVEILICIFLFNNKTLRKGLQGTVLLMSMFTLYIGAILFHFFPRVPCSCGGVIRLLSWGQHLIFNMFFIIIAII